MLPRRSSIAVALIAAASACDTPGASVDVADARAYRDAQHRAVVDVDLIAHEGLGKKVGTYCVRVTFPAFGPPEDREECRADLKDGDTQTVRFVWDRPMPDDGTIAVRVRLGATDVGRSLAVPR